MSSGRAYPSIYGILEAKYVKIENVFSLSFYLQFLINFESNSIQRKCNQILTRFFCEVGPYPSFLSEYVATAQQARIPRYHRASTRALRSDLQLLFVIEKWCHFVTKMSAMSVPIFASKYACFSISIYSIRLIFRVLGHLTTVPIFCNISKYFN